MNSDAMTMEQSLWYAVPAAGLSRGRLLVRIEEAANYSFAGVCVPACVAKEAKTLLHAQQTLCVAVGAPLAGERSAVKLRKTQQALLDGADVLHLALNPALLAEDPDGALADIRPCVELVHAAGKQAAVILFASLLRDLQPAAQLVQAVRADLAVLDPVHGNVSTPQLVQKTAALLPNIPVIASGAAGRETADALLCAGAAGILTAKPFHILTGFDTMEEGVCMCF